MSDTNSDTKNYNESNNFSNIHEISDTFSNIHIPHVMPDDIINHLDLGNRSFSILHLNMRSLSSKMGQLEVLLAQIKSEFSCLIISETWFNQNTFLSQFSINGYSLFTDSRKCKNGGGVCVYIRDNLATTVADVSLAGCDSLLLHVGESGREVCTVLAVYRAPSCSLSAFLRDLAVVLPTLPSNSFIVGDFNIDINHNNALDAFSNRYINLMEKFGFRNIIESPTRYCSTKASLLDHIFVNTKSIALKSCTLEVAIADHLATCSTLLYKESIQKSHKPAKSYSKINYASLKKNIEVHDWNAILQADDTHLAFERFITSLSGIIQSCTTQKKLKSGRSFKKPWMTTQLLKLTTQRTRLHQKFRNEPMNEQLAKRYRNFRNYVTGCVSKAKREFYQDRYNQCKDNVHTKWRFLKSLVGKTKPLSEDVIKLTSPDGSSLEDELAVAEQLNTFFTNVGTKLSQTLPIPAQDFRSYLSKPSQSVPNFNFYEVGPALILKIIESTSAKKATGPDNISVRALKENKLTLTPVLTHLTNLIIKNSLFPDCLKVARVKPLFKKGDKTDQNNYRPISILNSISKIVERVLSFQIRDFLESNNLLTEFQFGFRQNLSTTDAINKIMEKLYTNFDQSKITQGVFLDFSKAFDTIDHNILIQKLQFYNFSKPSAQLVKSYLQNRKQFVAINQTNSTLKPVTIGVPQGSVLGPLLFLIYINDLLKSAPDLNYILFADDTNIFSTDRNLLNIGINEVHTWCLSNRLVINYSKTFQVLFKAPNKSITMNDYSLKMDNTRLDIKSSTKFLGIELDTNITFKEHLKNLHKKLNLCILMMRAIRPFLDRKTMINIYYSYFYPHLIYGIEFWGHSAETNLKPIKTLQKSALRVIVKVAPGKHVTSHFKKLKIMPLEMLIEYRILRLLFKNYTIKFLLSLKKEHQYNTRNDFLKIIHTNNKRGARCLLSRGIALFNRYLLGGWVAPVRDPCIGLAERMWGVAGW